jgi:hypothetical protein
MAHTVICHHADPTNGTARITYDDLCKAADLSRAKAAIGLGILEQRRIIERSPEGRSTYGLVGFDVASGWAQFPARGLYAGGVIQAFRHFSLRKAAELDALKLYFLLASRRDRGDNITRLSYLKIEAYAGIPRNNIRRALSLLAVHGLVHIDRSPSDASEYAVSNGYRLAHLNTRQHMGTTGRREADIAAAFDAVE